MKFHTINPLHLRKFFVMLSLVALSTVLVFVASGCSTNVDAAGVMLDENIISNQILEQETAGDVTGGVPNDNPYSWIWNDRPDVVTPENNYYGGARTWNLSEDLALHMCWCYGVRVTHLNPEVHFNGEEFYGHTVWSKPDSNDIVITDGINYIAVFDYDKGFTSTFSNEGSRSYRFYDWSAYFFADGDLKLTNSNGTVDVIVDGVFKLDPLAEWEFDYLLEDLIILDQTFTTQLLINNLPWE